MSNLSKIAAKVNLNMRQQKSLQITIFPFTELVKILKKRKKIRFCTKD